MSGGFYWGSRSLRRLGQCHDLLQLLFARVIRRDDLPFDLTILCGHRGRAAQDAAYSSGASKLRWPRSKHNKWPSLAVDVSPWLDTDDDGDTEASWDWDDYHAFAPLVKSEWAKMAAEGLVPTGVTLSWGGDWRSFKDGPHWELRGI